MWKWKEKWGVRLSAKRELLLSSEMKNTQLNATTQNEL